MCEQFKTDFINKICDRIDKSVVHDLEKHHQITVRHCAFKNTPDCKQFYVYIDRMNYFSGMQCKTCECFVCTSCVRHKTTCSKYCGKGLWICVNCIMKKDGLLAHPIAKTCELCASGEMYHVDTGMLSSATTYCKQCNSMSTNYD
jgi:hypothetical protein